MTDEDFSKLVAEGMDAIPDEFAEHIDNVVVVFADEPSEQQRQELHLRDNTVLFGLYEGIKKRYVNKLLKLFGTKLLIILV